MVDVNGCWQWGGYCDKAGYGGTWHNGKHMLAHRLAYELHYGPIPAGLNVLHSCDNRGCVNPAHLRVGTQAENVRDMIDRGRKPKTRSVTRPRSDNTGGVLGVCKSRNGWQAHFKIPAGARLQRYFRSFEDAVAQRQAWEREYSRGE